MKTIRLYGWLGTRFGRTHRLAVMSTSEAMLALCATLKGFEAAVLESHKRGVRYACFLGARNIGEADLDHRVEDEDIRIAPILQGSKRGGLFQIVLGAALIGASFIPGVNAALWSGAQGMLFGLGVSMAVGGVMQLIAPQQRGLSTRDNPENGASYNFNGPVNTTAQGNCVPVLYGEMMVGSAVVSAGILAEDQA